MYRDFHIVVDGGGTKMIAILFKENGEIQNVIRREFQGNLWICGEKNAKEKILAKTIDLLESVSGNLMKQVKSITFTIPGFSIIEQIKERYPDNKVTLYGDHIPAYLAAFCGEDGICLSIGTGIFSAYRCDKCEGGFMFFGGWGPLEGDTGSGYYAGLCLLKRLMKDIEENNYCKESEIILEKWGLEKSNDIRERLTRLLYGENPKSRRDIAELSLILSSQAQKGSHVSLDILKHCGKEIADLIYRTFVITGLKECNYSIVGGFKNAGKYLLDPLFEELEKRTDKLHYVEPKFNNYIGSVLFSLKLNGVEIKEDSEVVKNIRKTIKVV